MTPDASLALLAKHGGNAPWGKHCHAVADAASKLGHALNRFHAVDHAFLRSAALLHDIGRCVTHDPVGHGVEGYHLLTALGHAREARVCAAHVLFGLDAADAERSGLPARDFHPQSVEERIVTLADLLIEYDTPTTLHDRFTSLRKRNAGNAFFMDRLDRARERAEACMQRFSTEIGRPVGELLAAP